MPAGLSSHSPRLILASASPRRQELMKLLRFDFEVRASGVPEEARSGESPAQLVMRLARDKAEAIRDTRPDAWVVGADTVVVCGSEVLGKPESPEAAGDMLRKLSGRAHEVLTGISIRHRQLRHASFVETSVRFAALTERDIEEYVATGEPLGKAGAYAIQGCGSRFVQGIDGCYFNVVGLPLAHLHRTLIQMGFPADG
ncbi:MAG: Maf family protein [Acidobacteriota bacterium]|nr:Maf family protein [Acidobacteriota bacterium]